MAYYSLTGELPAMLWLLSSAATVGAWYATSAIAHRTLHAIFVERIFFPGIGVTKPLSFKLLT